MNYNRRLPVYLIIDTSESMAGEAFDAVNQGLAAMIGQLRTNPMALETAALSVISFASTARQVVPLTDVLKFQMPRFKMGSGTALGAALRLWVECMEREVVRTTAEVKGDFKPICFLMTDGEPTDAWESAADQVRTTVVGRKANLVAVACGPDVDLNKLRRITETVLVIKQAEPASFAEFFKWVSASVSTASQKMATAGEQGVGLPNLPQNVEVAQQGAGAPPVVADRYVFIHSRCVKTRGFYVMRYQKAPEGGQSPTYRAVASHRVEDFEFDEQGGTGQSLQISTTALKGHLPCPFCQNPWWAMCANEHIHCCPAVRGQVTLTCPWCGDSSRYGEATFDVGRGAG